MMARSSRALEICAGEVGARDIGAVEVRPRHACRLEVELRQVEAVEIRGAKIGPCPGISLEKQGRHVLGRHAQRLGRECSRSREQTKSSPCKAMLELH